MARKVANPYYVALLIAAFLFAVTACAYAVMAVKMSRANEGVIPDPPTGLLLWLDQYGSIALMIELAVLAALAFTVIAMDEYRKTERGNG